MYKLKDHNKCVWKNFPKSLSVNTKIVPLNNAAKSYVDTILIPKSLLCLISIMDDLFRIDIVYKGDTIEFETRLATVGYLHKFYVTVGKFEVIFEPDEERNYRAIVNEDSIKELSDKDKEIIKLIAKKLHSIN